MRIGCNDGYLTAAAGYHIAHKLVAAVLVIDNDIIGFYLGIVSVEEYKRKAFVHQTVYFRTRYFRRSKHNTVNLPRLKHLYQMLFAFRVRLGITYHHVKTGLFGSLFQITCYL